MNSQFNCEGKVEVCFSYTETGKEEDVVTNNEKHIIKVIVRGMREALEETGLSINDISMRDFKHEFINIKTDKQVKGGK